MFDSLAQIIEMYLPRELAVMVLAMLPYLELKGAIPFGISLNLKYITSFTFAFLGSIIPSPFIIFFVNKIIKKIKKKDKFSVYIKKLEARIRIKGSKIKNSGILGLFIFVLIPLPGTGVWTGSLLAGLFNLNTKISLLVIILGNFFAGIIITLLSSSIHKLL